MSTTHPPDEKPTAKAARSIAPQGPIGKGAVATGEYLQANLSDVRKPIILTGAMRPYEFRDTDAVQNVTEALFACALLDPGVWTVMHSRALRFPGIGKDRTRMTFVQKRE